MWGHFVVAVFLFRNHKGVKAHFRNDTWYFCKHLCILRNSPRFSFSSHFPSHFFQSAPSSLRVCTPLWACMIGGRSTCLCLSAVLYTCASSRHPFLFRPTISLSCSCGPSCRSPSWPCWITSTGPGLSTCTAPTQVSKGQNMYDKLFSFWLPVHAKGLHSVSEITVQSL